MISNIIEYHIKGRSLVLMLRIFRLGILIREISLSGCSNHFLEFLFPLCLHLQHSFLNLYLHLLLNWIQVGLQLQNPLLQLIMPCNILVFPSPVTLCLEDGHHSILDLLHPFHHLIFAGVWGFQIWVLNLIILVVRVFIPLLGTSICPVIVIAAVNRLSQQILMRNILLPVPRRGGQLGIGWRSIVSFIINSVVGCPALGPILECTLISHMI